MRFLIESEDGSVRLSINEAVRLYVTMKAIFEPQENQGEEPPEEYVFYRNQERRLRTEPMDHYHETKPPTRLKSTVLAEEDRAAKASSSSPCSAIKCDHCGNNAEFRADNRKATAHGWQFVCYPCSLNPVFYNVQILRQNKEIGHRGSD